MERVAFKMKLYKGFEAEYKKRHDALWPDLSLLLKQSGICDYSIFLDENTNDLLAVMTIQDASVLNDLPENLIMRKWWAFMKDIMETNEDDSPVAIPLKEVFYLS
jgi:L-rhamnose mutarotase